MAGIAPNTTVKLLRGCNIDRGGNHTIFFANAQAQHDYFETLVKATYGTYSNQYYQRVNSNTIRLQVLADNIYDCNYMMFQNTNYGNKWFYAFIDNVNYVNDNATEIQYTIDVMQTWYFDYILGDCFVEREHTSTDVCGEHRVPEPFPNMPLYLDAETVVTYGKIASSEPEIPYTCVILYVPQTEVVTVPYPPEPVIDTKSVIAKTIKCRKAESTFPTWQYNNTFDPLYPTYHDYTTNETYLYQFYEEDAEYGAGTTANYLYSGYNYICFPLYFRDQSIKGSGGTAHTESLATCSRINITRAIQALTECNCEIVDMYQIPSKLIAGSGTNYTGSLTGTTGQKNTVTAPATFRQCDVSGTAGTVTTYTPKNMKMYCYPYKYLVISDHNGHEKTLRWEDFKTKGSGGRPIATFYSHSAILPKPTVSLVPYNYRGVTYDYGSSLTIADFMKTSWSTDSYSQWKAQNAESIGINAIAHMLGIVAGAAALPASAATTVGASVGVASSIANIISQSVKAQNTPDTINGTQTSTLDLVRTYFGFSIYQMSITADAAKTIDDYFTMYGYAINKVKIPNVRDLALYLGGGLRSHWNYIKTSGCVIHSKQGSGLPADAETEIAKIYDNGITFWMNGNEVGDYSLDNTSHFIPEPT